MRAKFGDKQSIQNGERTVVGYYKHNGPNPIVNTRRDFESAAYSETSEVPPGVYPILLGWNHYGRNGGEGTLYVEFKGTITDDFFPTTLAGNVIGNTKPKHLGEERTITRRIDPVDAIDKTGNIQNKTPNKDGQISPDIFVNPKFWKEILEYYQTHLDEDLEYMVKVANEKDKPTSDRVGTLRYASACVNHSATCVEKISRAIEYQKSPSFLENFKRNTVWTPKEKEIAKAKVDEMTI
jgi:hypothetical protein